MEETLVRLCHPHIMDVIGASLEATHELTLYYEVINDEGKFSVLESTDLFIPDLKCRLLIPQDHLIKLQIINNIEVSLIITWEKSVLELSDQVPITIHYDQTNHLPMLHTYNSIYSTA